MHAAKSHRPSPAAASSASIELSALQDAIGELLLDAANFVSVARVEATARSWMSRAAPAGDPMAVADALGMAMDLALFTPAASGQTAFDRLARTRSALSPALSAALGVLRQATFRVLRVETGRDAMGVAAAVDVASGERLQVLDGTIRADLAGVVLAGRLGDRGDGRHLFVSGVTPLDEAGVAVAMGFLRPGDARGKLPLRAVEAIYRHAVRHGMIRIPGFNQPLHDTPDEDPAEISELDEIARHWAVLGSVHSPADVQLVRTQSDLGAVLDMIASAVNTRAHGLAALSSAYAGIVGIQLETLHRRHASGSGILDLDGVAAAVEAEIAGGAMPGAARAVFAGARQRLGIAATGSSARPADLDRLIGRVQALRAKTVEQGCTEQEALAAAAKVAELLDRYGLSLSELDLKRQACEGVAVQTSRKRVGPIDECVPAIAAFFDCRVWREKGPEDKLRHVFFGMPADVVAARYLYDLVELAFETETAVFRADSTYAAVPAGMRRTATNSFGIGLARGIVAKLRALREAREATLRNASGRDLVVAKACTVDTELERLGLHFRARTRTTRRRVLHDAYQQGHEAGLGFEYTAGLAHAG